MSKYIIDVGDAYTDYICGKGDMLCLPVRINEFEDNWLNTNIPLTPYTEPDTEKVREEAYEKGLSDAKEGKATCQYCEYQYLDDTEEPCKRCCKAYMNKFKPKAKEEQIQVGDEVTDDKGDIGVCTEISYPANSMHIIYVDGTATDISLTGVTKTGRHFSEIAEVLRKMRGNN